jgi:hypothetical protein
MLSNVTTFKKQLVFYKIILLKKKILGEFYHLGEYFGNRVTIYY